jgi:hypothetical protein
VANVPKNPVITQPIEGVMENMCVTVDASSNLSGTFLWVITTEVSLPRMAIEVCPDPEIALNAYSVGECQGDRLSISGSFAPTWYNRPSGEKTVRYLRIQLSWVRLGIQNQTDLSYDVLDMIQRQQGLKVSSPRTRNSAIAGSWPQWRWYSAELRPLSLETRRQINASIGDAF